MGTVRGAGTPPTPPWALRAPGGRAGWRRGGMKGVASLAAEPAQRPSGRASALDPPSKPSARRKPPCTSPGEQRRRGPVGRPGSGSPPAAAQGPALRTRWQLCSEVCGLVSSPLRPRTRQALCPGGQGFGLDDAVWKFASLPGLKEDILSRARTLSGLPPHQGVRTADVRTTLPFSLLSATTTQMSLRTHPGV